MPKGILFWVIFVIVTLFCGTGLFPGPFSDRVRNGYPLAIMILIFILGWGVYGFVVQ